ncbi:MAG: hypothetical protein J6C44_08930, partial [Muribaculaceae bacterium]|nr:hypothetical protein [Muribaculaceae bacterium]
MIPQEAIHSIRDEQKHYTLSLEGISIPMTILRDIPATLTGNYRTHISELARHALNNAYSQGYLLATVIPERRLDYFFFDKLGFSTVIYVNVERYTSLHTFTYNGDYQVIPATYDIVERLLSQYPCTATMSSNQFTHLVDSLQFKTDYSMYAVQEVASHKQAIAMARNDNDSIVINTMLSDGGSQSDEARALISIIKQRLGEKPIEVWAHPSHDATKAQLRSRGMIRIIDCLSLLQIIANLHPNLEQTIHISDNVLANNNGYYIIHNGDCRYCNSTTHHVSLDINVNILGKIIFGSPQIGSILSFPSHRPTAPFFLTSKIPTKS